MTTILFTRLQCLHRPSFQRDSHCVFVIIAHFLARNRSDCTHTHWQWRESFVGTIVDLTGKEGLYNHHFGSFSAFSRLTTHHPPLHSWNTTKYSSLCYLRSPLPLTFRGARWLRLEILSVCGFPHLWRGNSYSMSRCQRCQHVRNEAH